MKIEHKVFPHSIHLLTFDNQHDLASTFLRFQEYYESPEFAGKVFSLDEYRKWYVNESLRSSKNGEFTYYEDWNGFNIPSKILKPFYEGKFDPLSELEQRLLDIYKNEKEPFYIIGLHKANDRFSISLEHEVAHGLFFINQDYREKVLSILKQYDTSELRKAILKTGGYHENVLDDEVHAYAISGSRTINAPVSGKMKKELIDLFKKTSLL